MDLQSSLSFVIDLMRNEREIAQSLHTREENHPLTFALSHIDKSHLLPNLFFSSSLSLFPSLFHNFIGHVLDSVNSVKSLVDYRLYDVDVMVRVGLPEER